MMFYDNLTGLPNAILFIDRLQQTLACAARRQQQVALIYTEIDGYAQFVELHGQEAGDKVIRQVSECLGSCLQREEDIVGRICENLFGVILYGVKGQADLSKLLEKMLESVHQCAPQVPAAGFKATLSAGVGFYPQAGMEWSQLLRSASTAMHRAREAGGNGYCCAAGEALVDGRVNANKLSVPRLLREFQGQPILAPAHVMGGAV